MARAAGDGDEFSALGVYNQAIYVHPKTGVVVVKLSANQVYGTTGEDRLNRDVEQISFFRHLARRVN